ncbi:MAG: 2-keto-4-pentenoate hydratase/2-oxohepta-3-ene-1,7-dioic acid hydratase in catechol pathway [Candidatus Latescibacterota bacterium]|jgi:2-keto-4-pentenoate hydratase/2-oxohepta-3-ene-1,7-dioic acid hydratase in catechol pathway
MRIIRFLDTAGQEHYGIESQSKDVQLLEGDLYGSLKPSGTTAEIAKLLAPVAPINIYCIGLNYREHAAESGMDAPKMPIVFTKATSTLCHPGDPIRLPACQQDEEVDYECELAVVIGRAVRDVSVAEALDCVLGYTCANDVSARTWQLNGGGGQWIRGKGFDTFCPLGPALVTADEIADPQALGIKTVLNGQTMQDHTTGDMIFSVAEIISFLSQDTTLLPGTVILTGTPQGVGFARKPPVWLKPGDEVIIELEGIGKLVNSVVAP